MGLGSSFARLVAAGKGEAGGTDPKFGGRPSWGPRSRPCAVFPTCPQGPGALWGRAGSCVLPLLAICVASLAMDAVASHT